jgi:hypothetical protein
MIFNMSLHTIINIFGLVFQGNADGSETEIRETSSSAPTSEDGQPCSRSQGCVRLRRHLSEERLQHPHRLHTLPPHLCYGRRPGNIVVKLLG